MREKLWKIFDVAAEYSLYGIILLIPVSNAAIESFFGFLLLFFFLKKALKPDFKFMKSYTNIFLLSFIVFISLSLFNSGPFLQKSLKALFLKWGEYILVFIITQDTLTSSKRARNCLAVSLGAAFIVGIDAIFQRFSGTDFLRHKTMIALYGETIPRAVTASFNHYNSLGAYLMFNLSLLLALLVAVKRKLYKFAFFLLLALLQICLMLTFSRGSWFGFLAALVIMLFLSPKINKLITIFVIFILVLLFMPGIRERAMFIFSPHGDTDRITIWKGTFGMIREHPFLGMGLGTYMDYFQKYVIKAFIQYAHNCYLQIWAESGIFSLLSFILFTGSIFYRGIRSLRFGASDDFILLGFVCAFSGTLVHLFFDNHLYSLQLSFLFWFMAGLICATIRLNKVPGKQST